MKKTYWQKHVTKDYSNMVEAQAKKLSEISENLMKAYSLRNKELIARYEAEKRKEEKRYDEMMSCFDK